MTVLLNLSFFFHFLKIHFFRHFFFAAYLPYKANFDVTFRCNLNCSFCQISRIYKKDPDLIKEELSLPDYQRVFKEYGKDLKIASFEGGEPFLRDDLADIVISAYRSCPRLGLILIATNGTLPEDIKNQTMRILEETENVVIYICFSLDGPKEVHNKVRNDPRSFDKIMESFHNLKSLNDKRLKLHFQTTICNSNWKELSKWYLNFDYPVVFTLAHSNSFFRNTGSNEACTSINEREGLRSEILKIIDGFRIKCFSDIFKKLYLIYAVDYLHFGKLPVHCLAGYATLYFDPYGNVKPCAFRQESLGNIKSRHLKEMYVSDSGKKMRKRMKREICQECWMNCDAIPSILHHFPFSGFKYLGYLLRYYSGFNFIKKSQT